MRRIFMAAFAVLITSSLTLAATATTNQGDLYSGVTPVLWGRYSHVKLVNGSNDTTSSWTSLSPVNGGGIKPGTSVTVSYVAKATDSSAGEPHFSFHINTRFCTDPVNALGCDSTATYFGNHKIYSTNNIIDTLLGYAAHASYLSGQTSEFYIPHANSIQLVVHVISIGSGDTLTIARVQVLGQ